MSNDYDVWLHELIENVNTVVNGFEDEALAEMSSQSTADAVRRVDELLREGGERSE